MLIPVQCPRCEHPFRVDSRHAGQVGRCPNEVCKAAVRIPLTVGSTGGSQAAKDELKAPRSKKPSRSPSTTRTSSRETRRAERQRSGKAKPASRKRERDQIGDPLPLPPRRGRSNRKPTRKKSNRAFPVKPLAFAGIALFGLAGIYVLIGGGTTASGLTATSMVQAAEPEPPKIDHETWNAKVAPFLKTHCFDCHGDNDGDAGLNLAEYTSATDVTEHRKTFEKIFRMVNSGAMPPGDFDPMPAKEDREVVASWLEDALYNFDCRLIDDPGRPTIQRLNRSEYNNTIRDLVGVDFNPADDFPSDDVGEGFDNIGDVLSLSPLLLEKYLRAAEEITSRAITTDDLEAERSIALRGLQLKKAGSVHDDNEDFVAMLSTGEARGDFKLAATGHYIIEIEAKATQAGKELAKMEFRVDGDPIHVVDVPGEHKVAKFRYRTRLKAGKRRIAARFINDRMVGKKDRNLFVRQIALIGPENAEDVQYPEDHSRLVFVRPGKGKSVRQAATQVIDRFATRAFRRPVTDQEVRKYVDLAVATADAKGGSYNGGIELAFQAILVSPHFLFRVETDPNPDDASESHRVNDYELASRLSYFLWSSMPDSELMRLAGKQQLHKPDVLTAQVQRMLADKKAAALTNNFATQWLNLRNLDELTPDPDQFPTYNKQLKDDMIRETLMVFEAVVKDNNPITDFVDADYSFVNANLAKHYGIKASGKGFKRVSLKGTGRAGVLTHASVLTLTSNPTRTSPVKRGKWILENILNDAPPDPPADVPDLDETAKENPNASLREQLALHRESPTCASCHKTMDPLGFSFERFDPVGRIRNLADGKPIDPSGELPSGESFAGAMELVQIVKKREEQFSRCLAEKLMTYALGRGLDYYDRCAIDGIYGRMKKNDLRFRSMIEGIVLSKPFQMRRGELPREAE